MNLTMSTPPTNRHRRRRVLSSAVAVLSLACALGTAASGCSRSPEQPGGYSRQRPPADRLDRRDRGLQSYDVIAAADQMAEELLTHPAINQNPSGERMVIVFDRAANLTTTVDHNLDIFLRQLRGQISRRGYDRIQIQENRARFRELQSRELEQSEREEFGGAGGRQPAPGPAGIQPDYALALEVRDLPNRGTNFYQFDFTLTNFHTREIVWEGLYDVRVAR